MSEEVLDEENWKNEAQAVINDIKDHVKSAEISKILPGTNQKIHLNFTTLEGEKCCVELSGQGFRIVGKAFDTGDIEDEQYFETPYALLSQISADFHKSFGNALMSYVNKVKLAADGMLPNLVVTHNNIRNFKTI